MNWYIEISGTSLSEDAKRICMIKGLFRINQLLELYASDRDLSTLYGVNLKIIEEIKLFCNEILSYFSDFPPKENVGTPEIKKQETNSFRHTREVIPNFSISQLLKRELINKRLYNICNDNDIPDLKSIFTIYEQKNNSFSHLPNAGLLINNMIDGLRKKYKIEDNDENSNGTTNIEDYDSTEYSYKNSFEQFIKDLDPCEYSKVISVISPYFKMPEADLIFELSVFYSSATQVRGVGKGKTPIIKKLLQQYFEKYPSDDQRKKEFVKLFFDDAISSFAINARELWDAYYQSTQSLIYYLFSSYKKFRSLDYVYINKFLCFYEDSEFLSYEKLSALIAEAFEEDIASNTVKAQIKRVREKIATLFHKLTQIIDLEPLMIQLKTADQNGFYINEEKLLELNMQMKKNLSIEFYRYLYRSFYSGKLIDIRQKKSIRTMLTDSGLLFVKEEHYKGVSELLEAFELEYKKRRSEELSYKIDLLPIAGFPQYVYELFSEAIRNEYPDVQVRGNVYLLPQNTAKRNTREDELLEVFKEFEEQDIEYENIVAKYDEKFPGMRKSYRSLKDTMYTSEKFMSLGGGSNRYILSAWKDDFLAGALKNLIIDFFEKKNDRAHFYEIYLTLSGRRAGITDKSVRGVLGHFPFFESSGGGYYHYVDFQPQEDFSYAKRTIGNLDSILQNEDKGVINSNKDEYVMLIMDQHPKHSYFQILYALDLYLGNIEV